MLRIVVVAIMEVFKVQTAIIVISLFFQSICFVNGVIARDSRLEISTASISPSKFKDSTEDTELSQNITKITATLPLPLNAKNTLFIGANYQHHYLSWDKFETQGGITIVIITNIN